ncbi:hypothetical protein ACRRRS_21775 (plasmid) [Brucella anthropi]|uniref:hypothetical protein n=1 Tax=Brucella anthropi TaxID=529 RepID=UPI001BD09437
MSTHDVLLWPADVPRSKSIDNPRTFFHLIDSQHELTGKLLDFGDALGKRVENILITLNHPAGNRDDLGVAVYFEVGERSICLTCDRFNSQPANVQAIAHLMSDLTRSLSFITRHTAFELLAGFVTPRPTLTEKP